MISGISVTLAAKGFSNTPLGTENSDLNGKGVEIRGDVVRVGEWNR